MKKYLLLFLINFFSLWLTANWLPGVNYSDGYKTLALAALTLTAANLILRPLVKILLLPINLLTLGAFRWLIGVATLYFVTLAVPQFTVTSFLMPGFDYQGFIMPEVYLGTFWAFVTASFTISLTATCLLWVIKK